MGVVSFDDVLRLRNLFIEGLECAGIACLYCSRLRGDPPVQSHPRLRQLIERADRVRRPLAGENLVLEFVLSAASGHVRPAYLSDLELPPPVVARNPSLLSRTGHGVAVILTSLTVDCVRAFLAGAGGEAASEASFTKLEKALEAVIPEVERESRLAIRLLMTHPGAADEFSKVSTLYPRWHGDEAGGDRREDDLSGDEWDAAFCLDAMRFRREGRPEIGAFMRARAERNVKAGKARDPDAEYERLKTVERRFRHSIRRLGGFLLGGMTADDFAGNGDDGRG